MEQICDGISHCPNNSDENENLCFNILCPNDTFRCSYGACIHKLLKCDGKKHCIDGSDENFCNENYASCELSQFKCKSGECIDSKKLCDGTKDCLDDTDENDNICEQIFCPSNTFHCTFGGCINLNQRCNGFKDCLDGSDESDLLCKSINCSESFCQKVKENITCPSIKSFRVITYCEIPTGSKRGVTSCDNPVPIGTIAYTGCKPYYKPATSKEIYNNKMICQHDGTWDRRLLKCEPDCGTSDTAAIPLILNGWEVEKGLFPWHAVLYLLENGNWTFICGGSLINEKIVITAAHCIFHNKKEDLQIALGKYKSDYNAHEYFTEYHNISRMIAHPLYQDFIGNYGSDIAILVLEHNVNFNTYIRPVCLDWNLDYIKTHLNSNNLGLVLGMGITEINTFSKTLKASNIPVISYETCINEQVEDFRKFITFTSFCAGWKNGSGVCNGDSGGGLVLQNPKNPKRWILQGIVSISPRLSGTNMCDPNYYTVYTKVGIYIEWILEIIKKHTNIFLSNSFNENNYIF